MNTNTLSKMYAKLTPMERLPLIAAAIGRNDEAERARLAASAPRVGFTAADFYPFAEALQLTSYVEQMELLNLSALFWHAQGLIADVDLGYDETECEEKVLESLDILRMVAYLLVVHVDAWKEFCSGINIKPEILSRDLPGWETVEFAARAARSIAFNAEQATDWLRMTGNENAEAMTVEIWARCLRRFFDRQAQLDD